MKVKELIEELKEYDGECEVIMQKDAEGNGYSPLCGTDGDCVYVPDTTWSGEVYDTNMSAEEMFDCEDENELYEEVLKKPRCVVLFPVN